MSAELTITIEVSDAETVGVHTKARGVAEAQVRPMLDRAVDALEAERRALEVCPYHRRSLPDTDLVCTDCRWRGGHAPDCPRAAEPWPTMGETG